MGGLQRGIAAAAMLQGEPDAVADRRKVGRAADPDFAARRAADCKDAGIALAFLIGSDGVFSISSFYTAS
jgi:hypothetical protein